MMKEKNWFNQMKLKTSPFKKTNKQKKPTSPFKGKDHTQSKKASKMLEALLTYIIERINILKRVINNFN